MSTNPTTTFLRLQTTEAEGAIEFQKPEDPAAFMRGLVEMARRKDPALIPLESPLKHGFTPGLYSRQILMPAGAIVVSKIHKTCHPFVVLYGQVSVWTEAEGWQRIHGPYQGVTQPGTQRLLLVHQETKWTTFHPTEATDLERIEAQIIEPYPFPELEGANPEPEALSN